MAESQKQIIIKVLEKTVDLSWICLTGNLKKMLEWFWSQVQFIFAIEINLSEISVTRFDADSSNTELGF